MRSGLLLAIAFIFGVTARAACLSPAGVAGQLTYFSSEVYFCDGNVWVPTTVSDTGVSCSTAGQIQKSSTDIQYCNASHWISMKGTQSSGTCSTAGNVRYNSSSAWTEWCDGSNWKATTGTATAAFRQKAERPGTSISGNTVPTPTFSSNPASGNLMICVMMYRSDAGAVTSVTDTAGNTYTKLGGPLTGGGMTYYLEAWYSAGITGGSSFKATAQFSVSMTAPKSIGCYEYSGLATSNVLDQAMTAQGTTSTATVGPITTTSAKELLFVTTQVAASTTGVGSGFTLRSNMDGDVYQDRVVNTVGSYTGTTTSTGGGWQTIMATFRSK